ncbi:MAG: acyltransferase [Nocardioides sp.]|nr:acyltransferase [Nocardioides sp.]
MTTRQDERTTGLYPEFPALDTLRLVGALMVLTTHTAFWAGAYTMPGPWGTVLARLDVGVAVFFVLSGFLLSRPWIARAHLGLAAPAVGRYFWKRVLRILPLYLVVVVLALTLIDQQGRVTWTHWLSTLTMTDIYVRDTLPAGLTQMWSLATEVAFYVALPAIMLLGVGRGKRLVPRRLVAVLTALAVVNLVWLGGFSARFRGAEERAVNEWLPAYLIWFALGIGLALLQVLHSSGAAPRSLSHSVNLLSSLPGTCWAIAAGSLFIAATPLTGPTLLVAATTTDALVKNLLYAIIGGALVFTGIFTSPTSRYHAVMAHPWLRHLGHISYGIFCIHLPILHFVMWSTGFELFQGHGPQIWALTLVLSVAAAEVLYRLIELPFMRLKNLGRGSAATTRAADSATSTR